MFRAQNVLVAGGTGMIGIPLVRRLIEQGAQVRIASLDDPSRAHPQAEFIRTDLMSFRNCLAVCERMNYVFNLLGVKGSPAIAAAKPADSFVTTIRLSLNLMEAARRKGAWGYLYTSSIAVYAPADMFYEENVWKTFPSENDKFPGWAKRIGELQVEAYNIQYGWDQISIVRPANVYGPYDNFDLDNAMVIPTLIRRVIYGEDPIRVWGNGRSERDFIHAEDVARGMLLAAERGAGQAINLGSGVGVSIRDLVELILRTVEHRPEIVWDTSKPSGDRKRILDISRARSIGFEPSIPLEKGLREVVEWYKKNKEKADSRYDIFRDSRGTED